MKALNGIDIARNRFRVQPESGWPLGQAGLLRDGHIFLRREWQGRPEDGMDYDPRYRDPTEVLC